jgi:prepilin-type N-terminal cleavage/methylation domain-containing protein/prepilin-type processing-associated H-X9-DG protein
MSRRRTGFTLVELLVVIGIIAILISILLPTLRRVRQAANTTACAAQMRSIIQGLHIYASENKGSMPYNFCWADSSDGGATPNSSGPYYFGQRGVPQSANYFWASCYRWCKIVSDQSTHSSDGGLFPLSAVTSQMPLNKMFICAELKSNDYYSAVINAYAVNPVILVNRPFELGPNGGQQFYMSGILARSGINWASAGGTSTPIAPARLSQLYSDNAVFWDTNVCDGTFSADGTSFVPANCFGGFGISAIDGGLMADPQLGYHRYRNAFGFKPTKPIDLPNQPILFHTAKYQTANAGTSGAGANFVNADAYNGYMSPIDQSGNARFRHNGDKVCNVAFADGSVKGLALNLSKVAYRDTTTTLSVTGGTFGDCASSEFLRSYLQIKPPANLPPEVRFK